MFREKINPDNTFFENKSSDHNQEEEINPELLKTLMDNVVSKNNNAILETKQKEEDEQKTICRNTLLNYVDKLPSYSDGVLFKIPAARIIITDLCPYSCTYCGVYYQKMLEMGKISKEDFLKRDIGSNEGGSVRNFQQTKESYLSPDDYRFLVATLRYYFGIDDVTLTGGDPFVRSEIKEIIDNISSLGVKVTALTKGLPLFAKGEKEGVSIKASTISRIIFSIDTLDESRYITRNLPLADKKITAKVLPNTLETIKKACELGYHVDINSIIEPINFYEEEQCKISFSNTKSIIDFALETTVKKVKFLELEVSDTLGKPYIEKYFNEMQKGGYFDNYNKEWRNLSIDPNKPALNFCKIMRTGSSNDELKLYTYRAHCSTTALKNTGERNCDITNLGELNINSTGEIVACQKRPHSNSFDLGPAIRQKNVRKLVDGIISASLEISQQQCPK